MPAGIDPFESIDIIQALSPIKAKKIIATKLDTSRRFGGILSAADAGDLAFCEVSISPHIADGFCSISPISLAKLILPENKRNISGNYM
jgi:flagellar biosynthesis protein FlhF